MLILINTLDKLLRMEEILRIIHNSSNIAQIINSIIKVTIDSLLLLRNKTSLTMIYTNSFLINFSHLIIKPNKEILNNNNNCLFDILYYFLFFNYL